MKSLVLSLSFIILSASIVNTASASTTTIKGEGALTLMQELKSLAKAGTPGIESYSSSSGGQGKRPNDLNFTTILEGEYASIECNRYEPRGEVKHAVTTCTITRKANAGSFENQEP